MCMARVIYDEARGEPYKGKVAVGHVVLNRVKESEDKTVCDVVYQKKRIRSRYICQFSGMCKGTKTPFDGYSLNIAYNIISGRTKDPTRGATHFHNDTVRPYWSTVYEQTVRIGKHTYYNRNGKN